jgi:hypothetical protein
VDSVHGAVDHVDLVHRGLAAIAASPSSLELGLQLLRRSRLPDEGRRRKREARGSGFGLTMARKAAERRHNNGEGSGGGALSTARSQCRERGRRGGGGAVGGADAGAPFNRVRGGKMPPGIRQERAVMVVCHNGDEGGHLGRGSAGVVVGSDEAVLQPLRERKQRWEAERAHARQWQQRSAW